MSSELEYLQERNLVLTTKYEELSKENVQLHRKIREMISEINKLKLEISKKNHPTGRDNA